MSSLPRNLDLHLIRILYLLLVEKNVSRVALKLNQPQPSISASLRKLRELTGDPILVRGARGMVPTQHGEGLLKPAKRILDEAESLFVRKAPFQPEDATRTFHIAAPDYLDARFLPNVVALLRRGSPGSKVVIHALGPGQDYLRMLSDGDMDLVIANWDEPPAHLHISKLFEDPIICTMRADSPYARRTAPDAMTLEDYLDLPHVAPTQMLPGYHGVIDAHLERLGLQRRVAVESPYFGVIPYMLTQSDLVLTTGRQFIRAYEKTLPLKSFTVPVKFPPMRFYQLWHQRVHQSTEHKWLRDQVSSAARALVQG
ncbi:LysR family transcriptional regulator [Oxalobacteraceae sp. CFBP 13730]|jgi:DNA-binding transcriptional LysR family regulator|uniref:DNA-binding transcriptional LysR family regulator n=1 Tax=Massilia aurea TaxID=373040 RepID=A0A7X0CGE3_9BURK|nr:LysR substrate-binding domain-containing protein [Massilia aurea]MBB6136241.1 DNA-binding transcriptional LysR family regulator [Massilia aurea]MBD8566631.1 LysR family transcriptional regulator [Oxalobacteraceae sp. CFBP 8763]MBD8654901.1 LysR family transcriptional regulator [Oxalobacteraceae sp. CFBP 13730]